MVYIKNLCMRFVTEIQMNPLLLEGLLINGIS